MARHGRIALILPSTLQHLLRDSPIIVAMTTREIAIQGIERYFDDGAFLEDLGRRVAIPTESQNPDGWRACTSTSRTR
jgi:hypothetical protein